MTRPFARPDVARVFKAYPAPMRRRLMRLRQLIFDTAAGLEGVGRLEETLRWGEPAYVTTTRSGSTIRIDRVPPGPGRYALFFHCQTNLVATFRELYPAELTYGGNRSILLDAQDEAPEAVLRHCIALALTYHLRKR